MMPVALQSFETLGLLCKHGLTAYMEVWLDSSCELVQNTIVPYTLAAECIC